MSIAAFIMIVMFILVYPTNSPLWVVSLTLIVSMTIGAGVGYAAQKWARVGVLMIGTWIGGIFGTILYSLIFYMFAEDNPMLALWLTIVFCSIIVSILVMIFFDHAVIMGSAIAGSYLFIRVFICAH